MQKLIDVNERHTHNIPTEQLFPKQAYSYPTENCLTAVTYILPNLFSIVDNRTELNRKHNEELLFLLKEADNERIKDFAVLIICFVVEILGIVASTLCFSTGQLCSSLV